MAPPIFSDKTIRCVQSFQNDDGSQASVRFFFTYTGAAPVPADMAALGAVVYSALEGEFVGMLHESWTIGTAVCTDLTSDTSAEGEGGGSAAGTLTGGRIPASTSMVISQQTTRRYRGGHSRVYMPLGDTTKLLSDTAWETAFVDAAQSGWEVAIPDIASDFWAGAGTITQVMVSFYSGFTNEVYGSPPKYRRVPTPRAAGVTFPIVNYVAQPNLGSQRRRLAHA